MGPAVYIMAILGCGEGTATCEPVATMPTQYVSANACDAESDDAIRRHIDVDYPVVVAQCMRMDAAAAAALKASDVKLPAPERTAPVRRATFKPGHRANG